MLDRVTCVLKCLGYVPKLTQQKGESCIFVKNTFQSSHAIRDSISFIIGFLTHTQLKQTHIAFAFEAGKLLNNKTPPFNLKHVLSSMYGI